MSFTQTLLAVAKIVAVLVWIVLVGLLVWAGATAQPAQPPQPTRVEPANDAD